MPPPVDPSTSYATGRVGFLIGTTDLVILGTQIDTGFAKAGAKLDKALPQLADQLTSATAQEAAVRAAFFAYSTYLGGLEIELEGLDGDTVTPVVGSDVTFAELNFSGGRLFPPPMPGATIASYGPARIPDLFGGPTSHDANNETDGIAAELPLLASNLVTDDTAWHAAMTVESAGLAEQIAGLNIIAAAPWNVNVSALLANIAAAQASIALYQAQTMPIPSSGPAPSVADRTAFLTTRQAQITARVTANGIARNLEYEIRFEILDSLVNRLHGVGRRGPGVSSQITLLTEQRAYFTNFVKIYNAIGS